MPKFTLPEIYPGMTHFDAFQLQNLIEAVRSVSEIQAGPGIELHWTGSGCVISLDFDELPVGPLPTPIFRRARIENYGSDNRCYVGYLIDHKGNDVGDEIELYISRGVPNNEPDVRYYWPRLIGKTQQGVEVKATDLIVTSFFVTENGKTVRRWYVLPPFGVWCEREAEPGIVSDLPFEVPSAPGEPVPPVDVFPVPPPSPSGREPPLLERDPCR